MPFSTRVALFVLLAAALATACGNDSNPLAGSPTCGDPHVACLSMDLTPNSLTYTGHVNSIGVTQYTLTWAVSHYRLDGYAPGRRVILSLNFTPPLVLRYVPTDLRLDLLADAVLPPSCFDRFATREATADKLGDWPLGTIFLRCEGNCTDGKSAFEATIPLQPVDAGALLRYVSLEFVPPDTYATGGSPGTPVLPGNLSMATVGLAAEATGTAENDPPFWQGTYSPPAAAAVAGTTP